VPVEVPCSSFKLFVAMFPRYFTIPCLELCRWLEVLCTYCLVWVGFLYTLMLMTMCWFCPLVHQERDVFQLSLFLWHTFRWFRNVFSLDLPCGHLINMSSTYLDHMFGLKSLCSSATFLKLSMCMLLITGDNGGSHCHPILLLVEHTDSSIFSVHANVERNMLGRQEDHKNGRNIQF
jgi:hypothetical protein